MAEALGVVSAVASIVQLVDFSKRVLDRLADYQTKLGGLPTAFRRIKVRLPVLLEALEKKKAILGERSVRGKPKKALRRLVHDCFEEIKALDNIITKALPARSDSWAQRSRKALSSLRYENKIEEIDQTIQGHIEVLTFHAVASATPHTVQTNSRTTPCSTVPFRRDPEFIDRDVLVDIARKCRKPASRVALVGLGGAGKSQIAIEYSYRVRDKSSWTWVFWVHCGTRARFENDYRKIAEVTRMDGWDDPRADTMRLVKSWLFDESNGPWMLVVDNVDDINVFSTALDNCGRHASVENSSCRTDLLTEYLPQSSSGSILVTSRSRDVASKLTGSYRNIVPVDSMNQSEAIALLRSKLQGKVRRHDGEALVDVLDRMPLAISQAAAYINQRAPRTTASSYVRNLQKGDRFQAKLLSTDLGDLRRDSTRSNSIIATWQTSFEHIRRERPSAARLLSLMSMFDRQGISGSLLSRHYLETDRIQSSGASSSSVGIQAATQAPASRDDLGDMNFEDDLATLMSYSLISLDRNGNQFSMHRLVQYSTRKWLELNDDLEEWKEQYLRLLNVTFPCPEPNSFKQCKALLPHVHTAMDLRPDNPEVLATWIYLLDKVATYEVAMCQDHRVRVMLTLTLRARESSLGLEHPDTIENLMDVGRNLGQQREYAEAEAVILQALERGEKALGKDHPAVLDGWNSLTCCRMDQGRSQEIKESQKQLVDTMKRVLGLENSTTLLGIKLLATIQTNLGQWDEAERLYLEALEVLKRVFGEADLRTLMTMVCLGDLYKRCGRFGEAAELFARSLDLYSELLGEEHPGSIEAMYFLCRSWVHIGRSQEAIVLMKKYHQLHRKVFGPDSEPLEEWE